MVHSKTSKAKNVLPTTVNAHGPIVSMNRVKRRRGSAQLGDLSYGNPLRDTFHLPRRRPVALSSICAESWVSISDSTYSIFLIFIVSDVIQSSVLYIRLLSKFKSLGTSTFNLKRVEFRVESRNSDKATQMASIKICDDWVILVTHA